MRKYNCSFVLLAAVVAVFAFAANVQADTVLFSDSFDGAAAGSDYGLNDNLSTRLSGTLAPSLQSKAWAVVPTAAAAGVQVNAASFPNVLACTRVGSTMGSAIIQNNFNTSDIASAGGFDLIFSVLPATASNGNGATIGLGCESASGTEMGTGGAFISTASVDFLLYIRSNGLMGIRHGAVDIGLNTGYAAGYSGTGWNTFDLHVATTSFAAGVGTATATLYYSPGQNTSSFTQIALTSSGTTNTGLSTSNGIPYGAFTWTWDGTGTSNNYIAMGQYVTTGSTEYDNVTVTEPAVPSPEPSTLALLAAGLSGLLCYAWRKRR